MHSIIIPVDFTKRSKDALNYANSLFSEVPVRVILLHAHSAIRTKEFLISIEDIIEKDIMVKLEREGESLRQKMKNENLELAYHYEEGDIITAISNAMAKYNAELLIIGSDGDESWNDVSFREEGRTLNIVRDLPIPTLIVPTEKNAGKPKNILFATLIDGIKENKDVEPLKTLTSLSGAHLDVLSVGPESASEELFNSELISSLNGYLDGLNFSLHTLLESDTFNAIEHFSHDHENDLVCIIYRKHGVLERLLKPSVSKKVLTKSGRPILALKRSEEK